MQMQEKKERADIFYVNAVSVMRQIFAFAWTGLEIGRQSAVGTLQLSLGKVNLT